MMKVTLLLIACFAVSHGYPSGPPLDACMDMFPQGHNASAKTTAPPFKLVVSGTCFKSGTILRVSVQSAKTEKDGGTFFEGLFVQARQHMVAGGGMGNMALGAFEKTDKELRTMDCFNKPKSAASHSAAHHYFCKEITWTAPADLMEDIVFTSTVVHEVPEFWLNVNSPKVMYDANCTIGTTLPAALCEAPTSGTREMGASILTMGSLLILLVAFRA